MAFVLTFVSGLGLMYSLIIAVGAQNVFVLRQGLRREHVLPVVLICAVSDAALVAAGTAGLGFLVAELPWLIVVARWLGGLSLVIYGILAARRACRAEGETFVAGEEPASGTARASATATATRPRLTPVLIATLAFTFLNPNVYLDTVLLIGSIAATHGEARWVFAAGAIVGSITWFLALGFGARHLGRWLRTPRAWRILDTAIAALLVVMGILLVLPIVTG